MGTLVLALPVAAGPPPDRALARASAQPASEIATNERGAAAANDTRKTPSLRLAQMEAPDLIVRLDRLENQVRQLTGQVEQLQYRNQQLEQQLRRMQEEAELRQPEVGGRGAARMAPGRAAGQPAAVPPPTLPAQAGPSPAPEMGSLAATDTVPRRGDAFDPGQNPNAPGAPRMLGSFSGPQAGAMAPASGPGGAPSYAGTPAGQPVDLATAPGAGLSPSLPGSPAPTPSPIALAPNATPKDEFDLAYGYVLHKDYALAEQAFRDFLGRFPGDRMVPDAQYWRGEALFQLQRYHDAAELFLALSTKYETAGKAPDALLRLGQSLAALNEKQAACATFGEVVRKYPHASVTVRQSVDRELKRVHC